MCKTPFFYYMLMIILGIGVGLSNNIFLQNTGLFISDIFIRIFKFISMPIIALSLIVAISRYANKEGGMRKVWQRTISYTFTTTFIAASISGLLYMLIQPENVTITHSASIISNDSSIKLTYWQYVASIIPNNIFTPFLEHQVITVLLMGILIGFANRYIPEDQGKKVIQAFFLGLYNIFFILTRWVIVILPIGIFGFVTVTVLQLKKGANISGVIHYLEIIISANLIQGFIILPLWLMLNKINPFISFKKMIPALSLAFFSKSSVGTLPVTMKVVESELNIPPKISRFVLPLCTSLNMNGCAAFILATVIFLMQNNGIVITPATIAIWVVIATIAAVGNAGVPMGCFFLSASLLTSMDVPIVLLGVILPFYTMVDMVETALNVWSDACVTQVVSKKDSRLPETAPGIPKIQFP